MTEDQTFTFRNIVSELIDIYESRTVDFNTVRHLLMEIEMDFPNECDPFIDELKCLLK